MKTLQHTVVITVPVSRLDDEQYLAIEKQLVEVAGGVTVNQALGGWVDLDGETVAEKVHVCTVHYADKDKPAIAAIVDALVLRLLQLGEQAVLVKDDDFAYVYYQSDKKGLEP